MDELSALTATVLAWFAGSLAWLVVSMSIGLAGAWLIRMRDGSRSMTCPQCGFVSGSLVEFPFFTWVGKLGGGVFIAGWLLVASGHLIAFAWRAANVAG